MAGYIFSLDSLDSLHRYTRNGVYGTKLSAPSHSWKVHHEGTFADYASMRTGDNIYFFIKRKIYGIGKLINVGSDCKFFNFPGAGSAQPFPYETVGEQLLWDEGAASINQRCICVFEPDPYFFRLGIDMDDVLSSNPDAFRMLRVFWKLSFIKFDDEENQAFRDVILKRNQHALSMSRDGGVFEFEPVHEQIAGRLSPEYAFDHGMSAVLAACADGDRLRHEMAIEAGLLHQLSLEDNNTSDVFGNWDYLSHQVVASPFKPVDYMDKMDLFGYAYVSGFKPTRSRFIVCEIKRGAATLEDIDQLLKYVDWVRDEYSYGDYSMIRAFFLAYEFDQQAVEHKQTVGTRRYTVGVRPAQSLEWNDVKLVRYAFDGVTNRIDFRVIG
ncbi:MAG: hypothetical protein QOH41_1763 [Blastocatellia bacterium]|jgi:hypothetical protein|nr:hypothetical protein [Blastocatellia bacterium]